MKNKYNIAKYIKEKLGATVIATSLIPQDNGSDIVMERCEINGSIQFVIIHEADNVVIVS